MINDSNLFEIEPKQPSSIASYEHVQSGIPIPKAARIRLFSPSDWEEFVEEWSTSLKFFYTKVRRLGGTGDFGVDIAGFRSENGFQGVWDNYQCKHYAHPLQPSDIWVEIAKIIYYSSIGMYIPPQKYYFICSQGIGTSLEKLLNNSEKLKLKTKENWIKYCQKGITSTSEILLINDLLTYFDKFDFSIFSSRSHIELIDEHSKTSFHSVRFGGGLPPRPLPDYPPLDPTPLESRYIRQLLNAYGDHVGIEFTNAIELDSHDKLKNDYLRQRERFYSAESLRNFARDTVPEGTFDALQNEVYHGVIDICEGDHSNGFNRMKAVVTQAVNIAVTSSPLAPATKAQDRQGICHQLANENRLKWIPEHE